MNRARAFAAALALLLSACSGEGEPRAGGLASPATASGPLALSDDGRTLWVVNPDADSVTAVDVSEPAAPVALGAIAVGAEPWSVAVVPTGAVVVMNRAGGSLSFLEQDGGGAPWRVVGETYVGAEPGGVVLSSDGGLAFVTLSGDDAVAVVDVGSRQVIERIEVGPQPWAVARSGETLVVAHRLARPVDGRSQSANDGRQGWLTLVDLGASGGAAVQSEVPLAGNAYGFPNALESLAVVGGSGGGSGDGAGDGLEIRSATGSAEDLLDDVVYVAHLLNSPEPPNDFQTSVSGGLSAVSLTASTALPERSLDINDPGFSTPVNFPRAIAATPDGQTLYLALAGSDAVMGIDVSDPSSPELLGFWPTGSNPRGIVVAPDGMTAYVHNYLSRDVSVLDISDTSHRREVARVTVTGETLSPELHRGKVLFNNANDPRLSLNGWLSCASCHLDGGGDGTTWPREEGARQTMPLWNLAGTAPFHAAGTRDELQDFETDIERFMRGVGLAPGAAPELLGQPSAGASADLDALAAFLADGIRAPAAPAIEPLAAARGRAVFAAGGCQECHGGTAWTTSTLPGPPGSLAAEGETVVVAALHDVGTFNAAHDITGAVGFDVPTLLGLAYTAPYFHDGSAATLSEVLAHAGHSGSPLEASAAADLTEFLRSIDAGSEPFGLP